MRSVTKKGLAPLVSPSRPAAQPAAAPAELFSFGKKRTKRIRSADITFIFRNLATLVDNGVSLPKALQALADEKALEHCQPLLKTLKRELESGSSFSGALAKNTSAFDVITINQVRVGERAGSLVSTLDSIAAQREKAGKLRREVIKKLSYPGMLSVMGVGVITFLLAYVVPVFEETYTSAKVPLPGVTQTLIYVGAFAQSYGPFIALALAVSGFAVMKIRKREHVAARMDAAMLRLPLLGDWLRDIAVLQMMNVLGNLMDAGFTLAEALAEAASSVNNRAVKSTARELEKAVRHGEKFSREIERHGNLFPPIVSQLVIVGEKTGGLTKATRHIRTHLQDEIERRTGIMVGVLEPVLTVGLATAVAVILLAIYLPMFDMINTVGG